MRLRSAGWLAAAVALVARAALADGAPPPAKAGPTCEAERPQREAVNFARLVESMRRLEGSQEPRPDQVVPLDNRGYNYREPLPAFPEIPGPPQR